MKYNISKKLRMVPMNYFIIYFILSYSIFLSSDAASKIDNLPQTTFYVLSFYITLYSGYWLGARSKAIKKIHNPNFGIKLVRKLIFISSLYYIIWGLNQISDFGSLNFSSIISTVLNPGEAYQNKFDVFDYRVQEGVVNRLTQVLLLLSTLSSLLVILIVVYWNQISTFLKILSLLSILVFLISYMYIGTQKGLGDVLIYAMTGFCIKQAISEKPTINKNKKSFYIKAVMIILTISMFSYMIYNQGLRALQFGQQSSALFDNIWDGYIYKLFGEQFAFGFFNTIGYPSTGYLGLSHNLTQDFTFSFGSGLSPAFESYRYQYFGGDQNSQLTYPERTELATGWPAKMRWSTAFPWFASDLTFPGTIVFMFLMGFVFSRVWLKSICEKDILAYAALGQFFIFLTFLPANNQVLMQRQGFLIVISLIVLALYRALIKRRYYA